VACIRPDYNALRSEKSSQSASSCQLTDLPVVVCSTLMNERMIEHYRAGGGDVWISRPRVVELVGMMVQLVLGERAAAAV